MKLECWITVLTAVLLSIPSAAAILPPDVTFIPDKVSVNSSFIMIADPHPSAGESGVTVRFIAFGTSGYGLIPFNGDRYVCYFSNTDPQSNCGMNFFPGPSYGVPYEIEVNASTLSDQQSTLLNVSIGGIPITSEIVTSGNAVYIKAWAGGPITGAISYKVYDSAGLSVVKSGTMVYNANIYGYTVNITLSNGEYYIAFTASSATDFGGGVSRVVVGGGSQGSPEVQVDSIIYNPVIDSGQEFKIETFKITNLGTENLTSLSITVPTQISAYLTITPKKVFLEPNESTYMVISLHNIESSANISTFATLLSGSTEIKQIPVELRISVIGGINPTSCVGKNDMDPCLGGKCCGGQCITVAIECCGTLGCSSGETCSNYKCIPGVVPGDCGNKNDMDACGTAGICCDGSCIEGGECCSISDCSYDETCTFNYLCEASGGGECYGKAEGAACSIGYCCSGFCQECCTDSDCTGAGEVCSYGVCTSSGNGTNGGGGIDVTTIALIGGGVAAAAVAGFFLFKKFVKKKGKDEGEEEFQEGGGEEGEDEFSDEDFY